MVCNPFYQIRIEDFNKDINDVISLYAPEDGTFGEQDLVPIYNFLDFFQKKEDWQQHIDDPNSPFMRILEIKDLFTKPKIKHKVAKSIVDSVHSK